jgi:hypothetical protein
MFSVRQSRQILITQRLFQGEHRHELRASARNHFVKSTMMVAGPDLHHFPYCYVRVEKVFVMNSAGVSPKSKSVSAASAILLQGAFRQADPRVLDVG